MESLINNRNQTTRMTLYEDGLLFRYESSAEGDDPAKAYLGQGTQLKLKFRQPFAVKDYYFEMSGKVAQVSEMVGSDDEEGVLTVKVKYDEIKDEDRKHLEQFVRDQEAWKQELKS